MTQRPIKFRARMKVDGKKWLFYQENQYLSSFLRRVMELHGAWHPKYLEQDGKHVELEDLLDQFTGLHDKNGKEIWESDILLSPGGKKIEVPLMVPVDRFYGGDDDWMSMSDVDYEVIGNVYENPELLK